MGITIMNGKEMKTIYRIALVLLIILSCSREDDVITETYATMRFHGMLESSSATKTVLDGVSSDSFRNTLWLPSDSILVSNGIVGSKFINTVESISADAIFEGDLPTGSSSYYAAYPYSSNTSFSSTELTLYLADNQTYYQDGIHSDSAPMVAKNSGDDLMFKNICGLLVLQLTGNNTITSITFCGKDANGKMLPVAGKGTVSMSFESEPGLVMDASAGTSVTLDCPGGVSLNPTVPTTFYFVLPPATYNSFTLSIADINGDYMYLKGTKPLTIKRSERVTAKSVDFVPADAIDLSEEGTANCYLVSEAGKYKFRATVKGSSSESIGVPTSAEVLWESFGTGETPSVGDVIRNVSFSDGFISFNTPVVLNNGNAAIAVKDASGTILWSWHIWVCDGYDPNVSQHEYNNNAGIMMDRNLGATSATPGDVHSLGLYYQWGRKDPFLGSASVSSSYSRAASTGEWSSIHSTNQISYSVQNPMQFINSDGNNHDWLSTGDGTNDNTRWKALGYDKGLYDPCPNGWRVPDGGASGVWCKAFGIADSWRTSTNWDSNHFGMDFSKTDKVLGSGEIWYPGSGYLIEDNKLYDVGENGQYYSCTIANNGVYVLSFNNVGDIGPEGILSNRAEARSIRCVRDSYTVPSVETSDVSSVEEKYAICGGNVTSDGGTNVTSRGVVWSTYSQPTVESNIGKTVDGTGIGLFTSSLTGLTGSTTYYVRAYAMNSRGVAYGEEKVFTTASPGSYTDLSESGTANCYIVTHSGNYKFNGSVKGGTTESVGSPSTAQVLWESFGTEVVPSIGDIITDVEYASGYITFKTPSTINNGNAVIAVKDASGTILWSWHIWVCEGYNPIATQQPYNNSAGSMMDRNLGATSTTPGDVHSLGLLYQWGRKDPFLNSSSTTSNVMASSTLSWPACVESTQNTGKCSYAVSHPTTFITHNCSNYDWYYTGDCTTDNSRWPTSPSYTKGIYDPCPSGWRVPNGGSNNGMGGVWSTAFGTNSKWTNASNWNSLNKGMDFSSTDKTLGTGNIWYPATGSYNGSTFTLEKVGVRGTSWSCSQWWENYYNQYQVYVLSFGDDGSVYPTSTSSRSPGYAVRCVSETAISEKSIPVVTTSPIFSITSTMASGGGIVTFDGGASVTVRGLVWSTSENPTVDVNSGKTTDGSGTGSFSSSITGLTAATTYYVRAYATNIKGTAYGEQITFTTAQQVPSVTTTSVTSITSISATSGGKVTSDGGASVTARGVVWSTEQNPTVDLQTKTNDGTGTGSFTSALTDLQPGTAYYVRAYATNSVGTAYGEQCSFTTLSSVDLGLSVKWATFNVGASNPEDYGDYYAWGETSTKSDYSWSTYKWCNGSSTTMTKYCTFSSYGTVDYKTVLEIGDDVAHVKWGGSWRMPTAAEWQELYDNCTWTWMSMSGVNGYRVTSKKTGCTDRWIFLPAAGWRYGMSLRNADSYGSYWSSSLHSSGSDDDAYYCSFDSDNVTSLCYNSRYLGHSVRPVCD